MRSAERADGGTCGRGTALRQTVGAGLGHPWLTDMSIFPLPPPQGIHLSPLSPSVTRNAHGAGNLSPTAGLDNPPSTFDPPPPTPRPRFSPALAAHRQGPALTHFPRLFPILLRCSPSAKSTSPRPKLRGIHSFSLPLHPPPTTRGGPTQLIGDHSPQAHHPYPPVVKSHPSMPALPHPPSPHAPDVGMPW